MRLPQNKPIVVGLALIGASVLGTFGAFAAGPYLGSLLFPHLSGVEQIVGTFPLLSNTAYFMGVLCGIGSVLIWRGVADRRLVSRTPLRCPNCRYILSEKRKPVSPRTMHTCPECGLTFTEAEYSEFLRLLASR
ncbi:MAG: hypothetical protein IBJ10_07740 [Phycisphaerales bacterium]|nr:hypothetical protein [Phycisphaerales bacterium]